MPDLFPAPPAATRQPSLPKMRLLIVDDHKNFLDELVVYLRDYAAGYYDLDIILAEAVDEGLRELEKAIQDASPFDAVLLDYKLPLTRGDTPDYNTRLTEFCIDNPACCHWVAQLTAYAREKDLIALWTSFNLDDVSVHVLEKSPTGLQTLVETIFFREIRNALQSYWLAANLGLAEAVMDRSPMPRNFNIYRFVRRLGDVWPKLDAASRQRAQELFAIEPGERNNRRPKNIGFKSFTQPTS